MENIDLKIITEEHVSGRWKVVNQVLNPFSQDSLFTDIQAIEIINGNYKSINGKISSGKLELLFETEIIYNPQLKFYENEQEVENAIITRLYKESNGKNKISNLILYFTTGLELVLQKQDEPSN
jgi:hypothetical protein